MADHSDHLDDIFSQLDFAQLERDAAESYAALHQRSEHVTSLTGEVSTSCQPCLMPVEENPLSINPLPLPLPHSGAKLLKALEEMERFRKVAQSRQGELLILKENNLKVSNLKHFLAHFEGFD